MQEHRIIDRERVEICFETARDPVRLSLASPWISRLDSSTRNVEYLAKACKGLADPVMPSALSSPSDDCRTPSRRSRTRELAGVNNSTRSGKHYVVHAVGLHSAEARIFPTENEKVDSVTYS